MCVRYCVFVCVRYCVYVLDILVLAYSLDTQADARMAVDYSKDLGHVSRLVVAGRAATCCRADVAGYEDIIAAGLPVLVAASKMQVLFLCVSCGSLC